MRLTRSTRAQRVAGTRRCARMRKADRECEAAEQRFAVEFLGIAHDATALWRKCTDKACLRAQTCCGDVDACGARHFPEGWAWVRSVLPALLADARPRNAMRRADRQVIASDRPGDFGQQSQAQPRTTTVHYPGLGESFEIAAVAGKRGRRAARPARPGGAPSEGKGRRRQNALSGPLAPNLEVGHSR